MYFTDLKLSKIIVACTKKVDYHAVIGCIDLATSLQNCFIDSFREKDASVIFVNFEECVKLKWAPCAVNEA